MDFILTDQSIVLRIENKPIVINSSDKRFPLIKSLLKDRDFQAIEDLILNPMSPAVVEYIDGSGLYINEDGELRDANGEVLPSVLTRRLKGLNDEGLPITALINFWNNLKLNPSLRSREQLYTFLERNEHPLTEDGHFIAYKGVRHDFKDAHTGTFDNSVGKVVEMDRRQVDDDPTQTCSRGLHVAGYSYASTFAPRLIEVKVNPRDVVAVPIDYNGQKMRVCRYEVVGLCENPRYQAISEVDDDVWDFEEDEDTEESLDPDIVDLILELAEEFDARYTNKAMLAVRIEEELDNIYAESVSVVEILEILNKPKEVDNG